ncbi:MAG: hypothetical protein IAF58_13560 [Leptolyngbya sp.]|nr:hypothetical protein [Candidatus Melainabacteria bacterium]
MFVRNNDGRIITDNCPRWLRPLRKAFATIVFLLGFVTTFIITQQKALSQNSFTTEHEFRSVKTREELAPHLSLNSLVPAHEHAVWIVGISMLIAWLAWIEILSNYKKGKKIPVIPTASVFAFISSTSLIIAIPLLLTQYQNFSPYIISAELALKLETLILAILAIIYRSQLLGFISAAAFCPILAQLFSAIFFPKNTNLLHDFGYDTAISIVQGTTFLSLFSVLFAIWYFRMTNRSISAVTVIFLLFIPIFIHLSGTYIINNLGGVGAGL